MGVHHRQARSSKVSRIITQGDQCLERVFQNPDSFGITQGINKDIADKISRTPSRSPHRAATDSQIGTSTSSSSHPPATPPNFPPPSSRPAEPTIREETAASVSRTLNARHGQPLPATTNGSSAPSSSSQAPGHSSSGGGSRSKTKYRMVGDWQLQKTLGAGSMGKVKLGLNIHTREKVRHCLWTSADLVVRSQDHPSLH